MEVHCNEDSINIVLERSADLTLYEDDLRLGHSNCTLHSNGTHLLANISLNACHTQRKDDGIYLIYWNKIVSMNSSGAQQPDVDIDIVCKYLKPPSYKRPVSFTMKGFGTFTYQFEFFESGAFTQQKDIDSYPLEFNVGEMMYMQIESITATLNTELFAESCWATPTANRHDHLSHSIIENGCKVDETLHMYTHRQSKVQFSMEAFKFKEYNDQIFISCAVILCKAGMPDSRCAQGCSSHDTVSEHKHRIVARDTSAQTSGHVISQGPLHVRHSVSSSGNVQMP
ncbi:ZP domain-containing protein-like [Alosa sapidissima]|uniref:ZP domain-containing protein-like n=1 Tax=Alosa sapidissima TaxID=34773 RepID=UPI001C0A62FA|nr:ZP domain-containing protein-like [Alosa sapidissima]